jgi:hypothetical protein
MKHSLDSQDIINNALFAEFLLLLLLLLHEVRIVKTSRINIHIVNLNFFILNLLLMID